MLFWRERFLIADNLEHVIRFQFFGVKVAKESASVGIGFHGVESKEAWPGSGHLRDDPAAVEIHFHFAVPVEGVAQHMFSRMPRESGAAES
jgi:hypothetical protein